MGLLPKRHSRIDDVIDKVLLEMTEFGPETSEFKDLLQQLERLHDVKANSRGEHVDPNTLVSVVGNFMGILAIIGYEQKHVVVSKALMMVARNKTPTT